MQSGNWQSEFEHGLRGAVQRWSGLWSSCVGDSGLEAMREASDVPDPRRFPTVEGEDVPNEGCGPGGTVAEAHGDQQSYSGA